MFLFKPNLCTVGSVAWCPILPKHEVIATQSNPIIFKVTANKSVFMLLHQDDHSHFFYDPTPLAKIQTPDKFFPPPCLTVEFMQS